MIRVRLENEKKFRELILYISQKCANDPTYGATMLNKILFYSDFFAFGFTGNGITNFEYQHLENGPAPKRLLPVRDKMIEKGELGIQEVLLSSGSIQKRPVNLRNPDLSVFSADEIALVDRVIEALHFKTAGEVSNLSHNMVGYKVTSYKEKIPYNTVFLSDQPLTDAEIARGKEIAKTFSHASR